MRPAACRLARTTHARQIPFVLGHTPPFALATPTFRFRALAALAGRAPLGGDRELVLACFMAARLAAAALPPLALPEATRSARVAGARLWLSALALPAALRTPLARLLDASAGNDVRGLAAALTRLIQVSARALDAPARAELEQLVRELTPA